MKKLLSIILLCGSGALLAQSLLVKTVSASAESSYKYLGVFDASGVPNYLEKERDVVTSANLKMLSEALPESKPVPKYNPQYITAGYDTNINIDLETEEAADVYVTFVDEGASYLNVLGFYSYKQGKVPEKITSDMITIIFPNVSKSGFGGGLNSGDKVKIGRFPNGTSIGFVLLANGFKSPQVADGLWKLYSDPIFNPESKDELKLHNVLLSDPETNRVYLGFEDIKRDLSNCDQDFNDALFFISSNPVKAIRTHNCVDIHDVTPISSGNNGGLESNGDLASLIARRNFTRSLAAENGSMMKNQASFSKPTVNSLKTGEVSSLASFFPELGFKIDTTLVNSPISKISTPTDLVEITNATDVFSVDYYETINGAERRISSGLATRTSDKVYSHSKTICDRLNNAVLEDVRMIQLDGYDMLMAKLTRSNGDKEYAIAFSIKLGETENELHSYWNIDEYPAGEYLNFQLWGALMSQPSYLADTILTQLKAIKALKNVTKANRIPQVFVKKGIYKDGIITLDIMNKVAAKTLNFNANIRKTELATTSPFSKEIALSGALNDTIAVEVGSLFDMGASIQTGLVPELDAFYLADGPWGVDYNQATEKVDPLVISEFTGIQSTGNHYIERDVEVSGEVKSVVNLFRSILSGDQSLDLGVYNALAFKITNSQPIEVVLVSDAVGLDWSNRFRFQIPVNATETSYVISLAKFVDAGGAKFAFNNLKQLVFSAIGDGVNAKPFSINVKNVVLGDAGTLSVDGLPLNGDSKLSNYPNPFDGKTIISIPASITNAKLMVYDVQGRMVAERSYTNIINGAIDFEATLGKGVYKYTVISEKMSLQGSFVVLGE